MTRRPDRHDVTTVHDASWAVHGGNRPDRTTGAIRTPIITSNSYRLPRVRRKVCGVTLRSERPASSSIFLSVRRTLFGARGVPTLV